MVKPLGWAYQGVSLKIYRLIVRFVWLVQYLLFRMHFPIVSVRDMWRWEAVCMGLGNSQVEQCLLELPVITKSTNHSRIFRTFNLSHWFSVLQARWIGPIKCKKKKMKWAHNQKLPLTKMMPPFCFSLNYNRPELVTKPIAKNTLEWISHLI